jgi:hypothetical protein
VFGVRSGWKLQKPHQTGCCGCKASRVYGECLTARTLPGLTEHCDDVEVILVGGLAFRTEAAALNDHSLAMEANRPQPLEVAALLKLAATNVLFPQ